jgi:hypothetical protein
MRNPAVLAALVAAALTAAACNNNDGVVDAAPPGGPPTLQIGSPFTADAPFLLAGRVRFVATCTDSAGPCRRVEVRLNSTLVASGTTGVDSVVSLAGITAATGRFVVTATGSHGVVATDSSPSFAIRPDTGWTFVAAVHGNVQDGSDRWALYRLIDETSAKNLQTGNVFGLNEGTEHPGGYVATSGAAVEIAPGLFHRGVHAVGAGGSAGSDGFGLQVRGEWAEWMDINFWGPRRFNTTTGATATVAIDYPGRGWLSDDGSVTYTALSHNRLQLFALLPDGSKTQVTTDSTHGVVWGMLDGPLALYLRDNGELVLRGAGGEHVLGGTTQFPYGEPYGDLRDGWALWATGSSGSYQLWTRSPGGQVRLVNAGVTPLGWSLGWDGKVLLYTDTRAYVAAPPYTSAVDVSGASNLRVAWHERHLYGFIGNTIFRGSW